MTETRSPLKDPPVRNPGQSTQDQIDKLVYEKVMFWLMGVSFAFLLAGLEWWRWATNMSPSPVLFTITAAIVGCLGFFKVRKYLPVIRHYLQGRQGEMAVGQFLEQLRENGYHVFHDIPSKNGNVDHVLVGSGGVFVIETKTNSKPRGRESQVVYDGSKVMVDGHVPDRDPIAQVRAAAGQVDQIIQRGLSRSLPVRPVLLYVRWYTTQPKGSEVWVINEKTLLKWVRSSYKKLSPEDARLAALALEVYVRTYRDT